MNKTNCIVTKIIEKPHLEFNKYFMRVEFESYGVISETTLMFDYKDQADKVNIGYKFDA